MFITIIALIWMERFPCAFFSIKMLILGNIAFTIAHFLSQELVLVLTFDSFFLWVQLELEWVLCHWDRNTCSKVEIHPTNSKMILCKHTPYFIVTFALNPI